MRQSQNNQPFIVRNEPKCYTLDTVSKFIATELDKLDQQPFSFSTWYLDVKFQIHIPNYETYQDNLRKIRLFEGEERAKRFEEQKEKIIHFCGFSWAYSFGLGKDHSYDIHNEDRIADADYMIIIRNNQKIDIENIIEQSRIISNLERNLGTKNFTNDIKKELLPLFKKVFAERWDSLGLEISSSKEFVFPIDQDSPEIIQRKSREYIKQNEVKRKLLNDPQAMIQFYEATHI